MKGEKCKAPIVLLIVFISACSFTKPGIKSEQVSVHGYVAPGFEEVRTEFFKNFRERGELGAAVCVYHKGEKVVDLWGGFKDEHTQELWEENTIVNVFSVTKGMSLLALARLNSDGLLDYNEKVAHYWPEFAQNGKQDITIEQLVTHKSGLGLLPRNINLSELDNLDDLSVLLEDSKPLWKPGVRKGYQAATVGLFEQQLVRRVDAKHRTIGQYFSDEIAKRHELEFYIGLPDDLDSRRLASLKMISPWQGLFNLHKPPKGMLKKLLNPFSLFNKSISAIHSDIIDSTEALKIEEPAGGGVGDARSLAKVYGLLATGGEQLKVSTGALQAMTSYATPPQEGEYDSVMGIYSRGSTGGYMKPNSVFDFGSTQAFGFLGAGGSFAFADPTYELGYAYVMNKMDFYGMNDPRETSLRQAVYRSIKGLEHQLSNDRLTQ